MNIVANAEQAFVPVVTESYARSLTDGVALFIATDGSWKVGRFGQAIADYREVSFGSTTQINDLTYDVTALAAAKGSGGGYKIYASANADESVFFEIDVGADGAVTGARRMADESVWNTETRLGLDLNGNGGIGSASVLINDSTETLMATANGDLFVLTSLGRGLVLKIEGDPLNVRDLGDLEFADVSFEEDGSIAAFLYSEDGDLFFQAFSAAGEAVGDLELISDFGPSSQLTRDKTVLRLSSANSQAQPNTQSGSSAEAKAGKDLNRQSDTPLTPNWTEILKTPEIRSLVEKGTADGARLNHGQALALIAAAMEVAGAGKLGDDLVADLRAIAARGKFVFGAKNLVGGETSYLSYVFDKIVNESDANAFFTGGKGVKVNLGNLSSESTAVQLGLLRDKWLLGKDLPNPAAQGDTANANAKAGAGVYKTFSAPLFVDGAQYGDINQGDAGSCYLMASLAAFSHSYARDVQTIFVANAAGGELGRTFGVRFFDGNGGVHWVTVNDQLVVANAEDDSARYAKVKGVDAKGQATAEMWVPLLEKAYAQFNEFKLNKRESSVNQFSAIEGGNAEMSIFLFDRTTVSYVDGLEFDRVVINGVSRQLKLKTPDGKTALDMYTEALNLGRTMWVGADEDIKDANGKILFKGQHAHIVIDADPSDPNNTTVIAYNPWGPHGEDSAHLTPFNFDLTKLVGVKGIDIFIDIPGNGP